jgi:hypothetical protein
LLIAEELDIDSFKLFSRTHPALLFPAFEMQNALQRNILGTRFWEKHANRRIEICKGQFLPIAKFMEIVSFSVFSFQFFSFFFIFFIFFIFLIVFLNFCFVLCSILTKGFTINSLTLRRVTNGNLNR